MRKIKEVLRLRWSLGMSQRTIARSCGIGPTSVAEYLRRAERAGLKWPLPPEMGEGQLERLLFPPPLSIPASQRPLPDWAKVHQELKRKGVTLYLLWEEDQAEARDGSGYRRFGTGLSGGYKHPLPDRYRPEGRALLCAAVHPEGLKPQRLQCGFLASVS